jgi:hypothetical protein
MSPPPAHQGTIPPPPPPPGWIPPIVDSQIPYRQPPPAPPIVYNSSGIALDFNGSDGYSDSSADTYQAKPGAPQKATIKVSLTQFNTPPSEYSPPASNGVAINGSLRDPIPPPPPPSASRSSLPADVIPPPPPPKTRPPPDPRIPPPPPPKDPPPIVHDHEIPALLSHGTFGVDKAHASVLHASNIPAATYPSLPEEPILEKLHIPPSPPHPPPQPEIGPEKDDVSTLKDIIQKLESKQNHLIDENGNLRTQLEKVRDDSSTWMMQQPFVTDGSNMAPPPPHDAYMTENFHISSHLLMHPIVSDNYHSNIPAPLPFTQNFLFTNGNIAHATDSASSTFENEIGEVGEIPENVPDVPKAAGYFIPFRYLHKVQKTMEMRRIAIQYRNKLELRRRNYVNELRHNTTAREELVVLGEEIMKAMAGVGDAPTNINDLQAAWSLFQDVAAKLSLRSRAIQKLAKVIGDSDMDLIRLDNRLYFREEHFLKEAIGNPDNQSMVTPDNYSEIYSAEDNTIYAKSGTSVMTDPLEHDYYDAIGDVTLFREHLYNFETEHTQELYARHNQRELGGEPEVPENEFWNEYFEERRTHIDKYVKGKARVETLYNQCKEENAQVDPPNLPPLDPQVLDQLRVGKIWNAPMAPPSENGNAKNELRKLVDEDKLAPTQPFYAKRAKLANSFRVIQWMRSMPGHAIDDSESASVASVTSQIRRPARDDVFDDIKFDAFAGEKTARRYSDPAIFTGIIGVKESLRLASRPRRQSVSGGAE